MRRRHEHGVGAEAGDDHPVVVDGLSDDLEAERVDALVLRRVRRILDCDAGGAARQENAQQQVHPLRRPLHDDDLLRLGDHAACAA